MMYFCFGSVPPCHLQQYQPFRIGSPQPAFEWQVLEVVQPYTPLPVEWPVVMEAATLAAGGQ